MPAYTNRLIKETSPYLQQHAHNPVDWYPWGKEAFEKAKKDNKAILISIGYSACHWCHVMERESFEDPQVAEIMNEHFVNIKVDREERPDVDNIYMEAVQTITGSGGWPLNVFVTPEGKPFYGGTYYPPKKAFNRSSWVDVLNAIAAAYREKKEDIQEQANSLTDYLINNNAIGNNPGNYVHDKKNIQLAFENIMKSADKEWGGFGNAPKFPQTFTLNFLLRYAAITGSEEAYQHAILTLDKMIQGGIRDHLGGGFSRYSTDAEWLAPHFEKMLYDNALLVGCLSEAYQLTKNERYKEVIEETLAFVEKELMHEKGGFFSALDADSEGVEGKFYVWEFEEINTLLGKDAEIFTQYYNISEHGNWEGKNILHSSSTLKDFVKREGINEDEFAKLEKAFKEILFKEREKRIRPALDDKLLLSWNALMNTAYAKAYKAIGHDHYKQIAITNMNFLLNAFSIDKNRFFHCWKDDEAKHLAFLDDYSFLIAALIDLNEISAETRWLEVARQLTEYVIENFADPENPLFYYTQINQTDILLRKKEVYDSAIPSGNSVMALNFHRLGIIYDKAEWREKAMQMAESLGGMAIKYPTSFGYWLSVLFEIGFGSNEIAVVGKDFQSHLKGLLQLYLPHSIIMAAPIENNFPLLHGKSSNFHTNIYLCKNYTCQSPVSSVKEFESIVSSNFFKKRTIFE